MIVSYNELDASVRKAFRGAGYNWGEAEEAGKAAIWLARNRLAPVTLALVLLKSSANSTNRLRPKPDLQNWSCSGAETCPLLAGIALADGAAAEFEGKKIVFAYLHAPGYMLPFLGQLALDRNRGFRLSLERIEIVVSPRRLDILGSIEALASPSLAELVPALPTPCSEEHDPSLSCGTEVSSDDWDRLNEFAVKTYVPASDYSRTSGAGAGVVDSD
jgi:hypothetical protein